MKCWIAFVTVICVEILNVYNNNQHFDHTHCNRNTNNTKFKAQGSNVILTVKIKEDAYDYPTVDEWETYFKTINGML